MRFILAAGAALSLAALPALAESTTVEFAASDGTTSSVVFNDDGTAVIDGTDTVSYTMDEDAKTICATMPDGEDLCATFEELGDEVGFATGYTNTAGVTGTATIIAKD